MATKPKARAELPRRCAQAVERIVASLGDLSGRTVIEWTRRRRHHWALAVRAGRVVAVELDHRLALGLSRAVSSGQK